MTAVAATRPRDASGRSSCPCARTGEPVSDRIAGTPKGGRPA